MILRSVLAGLGVILGIASHAQCITSYPHNQPFTSGTVGTPGTLPTNWANLSSDDIDWNVDNNGTNGSSLIATGPYTDHTYNNTTANGKYMYVESSGAGNTPGKVAILESPCFNVVGLGSPYLTFWYHMRGTNMGSLSVDVNANGVVTQNVWTASGNQGLYWKQGWLNLAAYSTQSNLRIRFRAVTGTGELSDIALDDVFIGSLSPVFGCNETTASNYSSSVNVNNGTCDYSCPAGQSRIRIDIFHDGYAGETSWTLKNGAGTTLASGTTSTSLCVPSGTCLVFRINDTAGDGIWHNSYGYGQYFVWQDGGLVKQGGQFGTYEETTFNCPPGFNCNLALPITLASLTGSYPQTLATFTTTAVEQWYDFIPPQTGQYQITTCGLNTCDTRLWLYDFPCNSILLSNGLEGATFADDNDGGCGTQAVVNANMPAGTVHHLRVGHNTATSGCGNAITVRIIYNGPVVGCMNPASCNYEPLATIPCSNCCMAFGNPLCPAGPDLTMDQPRLQSTLTLQQVNITDNCAPAEGCVRALGQRYVLRFATRINNIGSMDYYIGSPSSQPQMFTTNNCHGHAHYAGYADYLLFDQSGNAVPAGFKNGYCVIDVGCTPGHTGQFGCSNMGITAGCYDEYGTGTTCNWIDITDVPDGTYTLVLRTNWQQAPDALGRHETSYANNFAQVCINITRNAQNVPSFSVVANCPTWTDCMGQAYGDARYDCNGVCNGPTKRGDLTNDGSQTQADAMEYVTRILGNDIAPSDCNDLNDDNLVTVTDAALMVDAYTQQAVHNSGSHVLHYHPWFDFPRGYLSTGDQVDLMLANLDPVNKTVDVLVRNPTARVLGYEFQLSGITIQSAQNLALNLEATPFDEITLSTSLGGTKVIGLSYLDSTVVKNTAFAPLCRITYLALTGSSICITSIADIVNKDANNVLTSVVGGCLDVPNTVAVQPKLWLEGPYAPTVPPLMRDDLRVAGLIPTTEPYTGLGFTHAGGGGGEQTNAGVLAITGANAIVDWVLVEVRSSTTPYAVVATRSALLQRDGDVVGVDGASPVLLNVAAGSYQVAVRHRNHFGAMTANAVSLSGSPLVIDFRDTGLPTWGTEARKSDMGTMLLWAGNALPNNELKYVGQGNDRDPILSVVGGAVPTGTTTGYYLEDTNLSGVVKYTGTGNDRDLILVNIGGSVPTNTRMQQLP
ncbi:MAG: hypothetical protein IPL52_16570 [Flavobacteriales bacterium]|nr:hypothetical protein [Flavobacteriales bacterium]